MPVVEISQARFRPHDNVVLECSPCSRFILRNYEVSEHLFACIKCL